MSLIEDVQKWLKAMPEATSSGLSPNAPRDSVSGLEGAHFLIVLERKRSSIECLRFLQIQKG
jgi:hypothetical protein